MELKNATAVVTGGARGLGAAVARELVSCGAQVLISDIDSVTLSDLGNELHMPTMHCNVTEREQVDNLARAAMDEWGQIDLWINNAGVWTAYTPVESADFNRAHQLMEVNYFGTAYGTVEALKHMRGRGEGTILNIISVRGLGGKAFCAPYSASKFAVEGFIQSVRAEIKDSGIRIVGVYPFRIKTGLFGDNKHEDYEQSMEPADVARIIVDNLAKQNPAERLEIWKSDDVRKKNS